MVTRCLNNVKESAGNVLWHIIGNSKGKKEPTLVSHLEIQDGHHPKLNTIFNVMGDF